MVLFFHFLVMTATLFSFSSGNKGRHALENLIGPSKVLLDEVSAMQFQKPMIALVFVAIPVPLQDLLLLSPTFVRFQATLPSL